MCLVARNQLPCIQTTKAQTSLRIRAVWSAPLLFAPWKAFFIETLTVPLISVAEEAGLRFRQDAYQHDLSVNPYVCYDHSSVDSIGQLSFISFVPGLQYDLFIVYAL